MVRMPDDLTGQGFDNQALRHVYQANLRSLECATSRYHDTLNYRPRDMLASLPLNQSNNRWVGAARTIPHDGTKPRPASPLIRRRREGAANRLVYPSTWNGPADRRRFRALAAPASFATQTVPLSLNHITPQASASVVVEEVSASIPTTRVIDQFDCALIPGTNQACWPELSETPNGAGRIAGRAGD